MRGEEQATHGHARFEHLAQVGIREDEAVEVLRVVSDVGDRAAAAALDTEARHAIPGTALLWVEAGADEAAVRHAWRYEVTPAVWPNLWSVAGEWAGWNGAWLEARIRAAARSRLGRARAARRAAALRGEATVFEASDPSITILTLRANGRERTVTWRGMRADAFAHPDQERVGGHRHDGEAVAVRDSHAVPTERHPERRV